MKQRPGRLPRLLPDVLQAIYELGNTGGSSLPKIVTHVKETVKTGKKGTTLRNISAQVQRALKHAIDFRIVRQRAGKYRINTCSNLCPDKKCNTCRRRRRGGRKGGKRRRRRRSRHRISASPSLTQASSYSEVDKSRSASRTSRSRSRSKTASKSGTPPKSRNSYNPEVVARRRRRHGSRRRRRRRSRSRHSIAEEQPKNENQFPGDNPLNCQDEHSGEDNPRCDNPNCVCNIAVKEEVSERPNFFDNN